ncbi:MAG TPA: hypothetical protein VHD83_06305 [Puia sp.]|nr:hypothetical protein [Puia sp.]
MKRSQGYFAPAITLMLMAPLLTEVLPGATRFSSIFVLPIEMCVWGGGALLIRYACRKYALGWASMLLMGLALAIAEECLIQQTSLAPLVIRLKGQTYARAFGVNYIYFLWALIYEPIFVVFLSIHLVELIYPSRRQQPWITKGGMFAVIPLFLIGSLLAWYSWTQIARVKVFHQPAYHPPVGAVIAALAAIGILLYIAFKIKSPASRPLTPLSPWLLGILGGIWATLLFGMVLLGFGIDPDFPPLAAIAGTLIILVSIPLTLMPRFIAHSAWTERRQFGIIAGTIIGSMAAGQLGFIDTTGPDLYFKIITNIIALLLLVWLGVRLNHRNIPV